MCPDYDATLRALLKGRDRIMKLTLKHKFILLAALSGVLLIITSLVGYYSAYSHVKASIVDDLDNTLAASGNKLQGWLDTCAMVATTESRLMTSFNGDMDRILSVESLSLGDTDDYVQEVGLGTETGVMAARSQGRINRDPRQYDWWYGFGRDQGKTAFTEPYRDRIQGNLVISVVAPFYNNGTFLGTIFVDLALDTIENEINSITYRPKGTDNDTTVGQAVLVDQKGSIIASNGLGKQMDDFAELEGVGEHYGEMLQKEHGYMIVEMDGEEKIFAYRTMPQVGWLLGIAVPRGVTSQILSDMRIKAAVVTLVGFLLLMALCLRFSSYIVEPLKILREHARQIAKGDLRVKTYETHTGDAIGELTAAVADMENQLRKMVKSLDETSSHIAVSSEHLTDNTNRTVESSALVVSTLQEISENMAEQLSDIASAQNDVNKVFSDITKMTEEAKKIIAASESTTAAAKAGSKLMQETIGMMVNVEKEVFSSAEVVKRLGANSQEIGTIVEAISAISEQTNLLALNAAIEAARAGEHGRGFAVVSEEVRKLAVQSQTSAEEIKQHIASIQGETSHAVSAIEQGTDGLKKGADSIRNVGEQFANILEMVQGINAQMETISRSVKVVTDGAEHLAKVIASIDEATHSTMDSACNIGITIEGHAISNREIAGESKALAEMAQKLRNDIESFQI